MSQSAALDTLRDVGGVVGGFFASSQGELVASNMPAFFDRWELAAAAPRVLAVLLACKEAGLDEHPEHCVLRYGDYDVHVRREGEYVLCVLSEPSTNVKALRMACRLVARQVGRSLRSEARSLAGQVGLGSGSHLSSVPPSTPARQHLAAFGAGDETPGSSATADVPLSQRAPLPPPKPPPRASTSGETGPISVDVLSERVSQPPSQLVSTRAPQASSPEGRTQHTAAPQSGRTILYRGRRYTV